MNEREHNALERLVRLAQSDTGQGRRAANFLLAWWNAADHGGFDLADLFAVDKTVGRDMAAIFDLLARQPTALYPEEYRHDIELIIARWRPE